MIFLKWGQLLTWSIHEIGDFITFMSVFLATIITIVNFINWFITLEETSVESQSNVFKVRKHNFLEENLSC